MTAHPACAVFSPAQIAVLAQRFETPLWAYDAATIRRQIARLRAFDVIRFAQKAASNIHLLALMRAEGVLVDAVSGGEIERALAAGFDPATPGPTGAAPIVLTTDVLDRRTLEKVVALDIPVNCGSPDMLEQLGQAHPGHAVWLRINPGFGHGHSKKTNTGGTHSKHGIWHASLAESLAQIDRYQLRLIGLHMHIGSGVDYAHLSQVGMAMVQQVKALGRDIQAISVGGGLSIPYRAEEAEVDTGHYFAVWSAARAAIEAHLGHPVHMEIEPGRFLVAQAGVLIAEVRAQKHAGDTLFTLVDAGFNDLARPAMYGSYHAISMVRPDGVLRSGPTRPTVVAGPLCESGDVFTQTAGGEIAARALPHGEIGDLLVFHDAGAYGASMSSNYNSRGLLPEVLVDGESMRPIRRRQHVAELIALEQQA